VICIGRYSIRRHYWRQEICIQRLVPPIRCLYAILSGPSVPPHCQNWRGTCPCLVYGSGAYLDNSASSHSTKRTTTAKQAQRKLQSQSNRTETYTGGNWTSFKWLSFTSCTQTAEYVEKLAGSRPFKPLTTLYSLLAQNCLR